MFKDILPLHYEYIIKVLNNFLRDFIDHHLFEINNETDPKSSFYKEVGSKYVPVVNVCTVF